MEEVSEIIIWSGWLAALILALVLLFSRRARKTEMADLLETAEKRGAGEEIEEGRSTPLEGSQIEQIAHDLKNPLNTIVGQSQLLQQQSELNQTARSRVLEIERAGLLLSSMLDHWVDLSNLQSGSRELNLSPFLLENFTQQWVLALQYRFPDIHQRTEFQLESGQVKALMLDMTRLIQLLLDLFRLIYKISDGGKINVSVIVETVDQQQAQVQLSFRGKTKRSYPLDWNTQITTEGGWGHCQQLTTALQGELLAQPSGPEVFSLSLLLQCPIAEMQETALQQREVSGYQGRRRSILSIDHQQEPCQYVIEYLNQIGFSLQQVESLHAAAKMLSSLRPDLILIGLPELTEEEFAALEQQLVTTLNGEEIPVLLLLFNGTTCLSHTGPTLYQLPLTLPIKLSQPLKMVAEILDLQWIFHPEKLSGQPDGLKDGESIEMPPKERLKKLDALVELGMYYKIEQWATEQEENTPHYASFYRQIRQMAHDLDAEKINEILKKNQ